MKYCNIILVLLMAIPAWGALEQKNSGAGNELLRSYQREILFLSTYKKELEIKLANIDKTLGKQAKLAKADLNALESKWLKKQSDNEVLILKISDLEKDMEFSKENKDSLQATIEQARETFQMKEDKEKSLTEQYTVALDHSMKNLMTSNQMKVEGEKFFDKKGNQINGTIVALGSVAKFGIKDGKIAALYPTGGHQFRVWKWLGQDAKAIANRQIPQKLEFFMYESPEKEFTIQKDKTTLEVVNSGGSIAWIIVLMGLFAAVLSGIRYMMLKRAQVSNSKVLEQILNKVDEGDIEDAQSLCLRENNAVTRVVGKTLSFLKKDHHEIEDVIAEGIIHESQFIDRFGMFILVIASVAPLMGLLGTVTGMISTFDIITQFGTGNPKLLSGGISEALVTTMLGLIVAIPTLLVGQFLSAKNEKIKSDMEKWSLAVINSFEAHKVKQ